MSAALVLLGLVALVAIIGARPHGLGPAIGAGVAVALAFASGQAGPADLGVALAAQWPAYLTLGSVMLMTAAAEQLGLLERLAAIIEPRTRGPVVHAFRMTFALAALAAALLSNDAAVLLLTPTILALLRTVYPKRYVKFEVPFAVAVFAAAGVAPLVTSNPMNLVFCDQLGIDFNRYARVMVPVALVSWLVTYGVLARVYRDVLRDEAPALGHFTPSSAPLGRAARVVLAVLGLVLGGYPVVAWLDAPLWPVALAGGLACAIAARLAGHPVTPLLRGISAGVFPFLAGVFVLAVALERIGVVGWLAALYGGAGGGQVFVVGGVAAIGSAALNNHPMSVLNALALHGLGAPPDGAAFAALVGGDLGPRLLPVGSLAALLWFDVLRRHGVAVTLWQFVRVGAIVTLPTLAASLALLWLLA